MKEECVAVATTEARARVKAADLVRQHSEKEVQVKPTSLWAKEPWSQPPERQTRGSMQKQPL